MRGVCRATSLIPALKYCVAHYGSDAAWTPVRPPLVETDEKAGKDMIAKLDQLGFTMPGLKQAMAVAAEEGRLSRWTGRSASRCSRRLPRTSP